MNRVYIKPRHDHTGDALSPREQQVVEMVSEGLTRVEIAEEIGLSPHSVDQYCKNIAVKTGYRKSQYWKLRSDIKVQA